MLSCVVDRGHHGDSTSGAQTPMCGGRCYLPLDDILLPQAENMIEEIREDTDDDPKTWRPNQRSFPTMKIGFQMFERKLQRGIIREQQYLKVIRNRALDLFADYKPSHVADEVVAWLPEHNHIVNPPVAGILANRKCKSCCLAAN